ncbi:hypothetical protein LMORI2_09130 [Limnohabitans sp. MORI2]|uniref:hypothetical protein n=1 Tax=Limnohabitans sp. MORI2 TaxID=1751150 RepID=UPI002376F1CB|nr:hypothetical protein [Limnohabitans sp. MORI2]BDU57931.1 hypothetical protein LMORI2_09130 [Limnohabitans sp. MORI2]
MKTRTKQKVGIQHQLDQLANYMAVVNDVAIELEIACGWYHDSSPQYGGPPSADQLKNHAARLRESYGGMATVTGVDPCEKLPSI